MVEYTIAAKPTVYKGRQYRSRLEARWAAYFDLLGWPFEYEPIDLGKWSPDFSIVGRPKPWHQILVEVKPITGWDRATARKMSEAIESSEDYDCHFLLLGVSPFFDPTRNDVIGWAGVTGDYEAVWCEAEIGLDSAGRLDINPTNTDFDMSTMVWGLPETARRFHTESLWTEAANLVQWKGPKRRKAGLSRAYSRNSHQTMQPSA
jgi:hypothetical protein